MPSLQGVYVHVYMYVYMHVSNCRCIPLIVMVCALYFTECECAVERGVWSACVCVWVTIAAVSPMNNSKQLCIVLKGPRQKLALALFMLCPGKVRPVALCAWRVLLHTLLLPTVGIRINQFSLKTNICSAQSGNLRNLFTTPGKMFWRGGCPNTNS